MPGTRCGAGADASKQWPSRCQAQGTEPSQMLANRRPSRCQAPGAKQLAPLSTAWQRMATGKETKEGPNRCQAPGSARTCLRRLRQWSTASPVAAPPRDLRACDQRIRFTCCLPPATWGSRRNSGQRGSRSSCRSPKGSYSAGAPTDKTGPRRSNSPLGARETSPSVVQRDR